MRTMDGITYSIRSATTGSRILTYEDNYQVKILNTYEEFMSAYELRHKVFCEELKWVSSVKNRLEVDMYDEKAIYIGVFNKNTLLAFIRLILAKNRFMIEQDFCMLVDPNHNIRKFEDTAEASRMCVGAEFRNYTVAGDNEKYPISTLLFKGVYLFCMKNKIRYIYAVVDMAMLRFLRTRGFSCRLIGKPQTMKDGVRAAAVILDWRHFERINKNKRANRLKWFNRVLAEAL